MTHNLQDIEVSMYRRLTDSAPEKRISLATWLFKPHKHYTGIINNIRNEGDAEKRKALKLKLPSITPAGRFAGNRDIDLVQHSGYIGIDIDNIDPVNAKGKLSAWPHVYYAGLSASGRGVWALVPIEDKGMHREHFRAIKNELANIGLEADPTCVNLSRKRFYSFDNDPLINTSVVAYQKTYKPQVYEELPASGGEEFEKVSLLLSKVEKSKTDITCTYVDWIKIGGVLANCFGEAGRSLFHDFSKFHPMYNKDQANFQYNRCLRNKKPFGIGVLYNVAAKYDVYAKK